MSLKEAVTMRAQATGTSKACQQLVSMSAASKACQQLVKLTCCGGDLKAPIRRFLFRFPDFEYEYVLRPHISTRLNAQQR